jgi:type 1 glutamine amidotransferase
MSFNFACLLPNALWKWTIVAALFLGFGSVHCHGQDRNLVIMAGKPSHAPRIHEFNAGAMLLKKCLSDVNGLNTAVLKNGWPADESILESADAIVFYMDGGRRHEVVQEEGRRLELINKRAAKGVGIGFMHYGVDIDPETAGEEFKRWIGGHYETMFSCNPIWEPNFSHLPDHEVTRGVKPFQIKDEWYFNMRFISDIPGNQPYKNDGTTFVPILFASPSDAVRNGPYVHPKGPYKHIVATKGRAEAMLWTVERPDGGRGFGFTGGHYHDNWQDDNFRKVVLNTMLWIAKVDVPADGVSSTVSAEEINANLDPKKKRPKKKQKASPPKAPVPAQ